MGFIYLIMSNREAPMGLGGAGQKGYLFSES